MANSILPAAVRIVEMGPRDGLQNEKQLCLPPTPSSSSRPERAGLKAIETHLLRVAQVGADGRQRRAAAARCRRGARRRLPGAGPPT